MVEKLNSLGFELNLKSPVLKCSATIFLVIENYTSFSSTIILCMLGNVIIPLLLGTLRMVFTDSKEFIGVKRSRKKLFLYLWKLMLFLLSPLIHPMLMMKEKRAFTKVKNFLKIQKLQEHEKFSQLVTKWNQWQIRVKQYIKLELGLEAILQLTMKLMLLAYAASETRTSHTLVLFFKANSSNVGVLICMILQSLFSYMKSHVSVVGAGRHHFPIKVRN